MILDILQWITIGLIISFFLLGIFYALFKSLGMIPKVQK